jgi:hypothetical protein
MRSIHKTALILLLTSGVSHAQMTFGVTFSAQAQIDLSAAEQALFTDAVTFWDGVIYDHQDNQSRHWELNVDVTNTPASMGSVNLGSAGPSGAALTNVVPGSGLGGSWPDRFIISTGGNASFNVHPDAGALRASTIKHEIGHALGIGTLWEDNEVYTDGVVNPNREGSGVAGQYTGANAIAAYQAEFVGQGGATFIPVEQGGGGGTAHGHWNESDDFGQTLVGIVDGSGNDFRDELMTGWASPSEASSFVSNTTIQSLVDIGFTLEAVPAPEPSSIMLLALSSVGFIIRRRR